MEGFGEDGTVAAFPPSNSLLQDEHSGKGGGSSLESTGLAAPSVKPPFHKAGEAFSAALPQYGLRSRSGD